MLGIKTCKVTSWSWALRVKASVVQLLYNFLTLYGAQRLIIVLLSRPLLHILSQISPYHPILSVRSILILSIHLCLGLPSDFPCSFLTCILYAVLLHSCYMSCPSHPPWLYHSSYTGKEYKLWSSSSCSLLQPPVTSSLFSPNILSTLLSSTLQSVLS
jgi:hypothetical protein